MIHVCSLARLHDTVRETGARHVVTLIKDISLVRRPATITPENHLLLDMDDITDHIEGYVAPAEEHVSHRRCVRHRRPRCRTFASSRLLTACSAAAAAW